MGAVLAVVARALRCCGFNAAPAAYTPIGGATGGSGGGQRRGNGVGPASQARVRFVDSSHRFSFSYPSSWTLTRAESAASAILLQATCDNAEYAYMRFAISWDDMSWTSTTAEAFGRGLARQYSAPTSIVRLGSQGLYNQYSRADGAYSLSYTVPDPVDGSEMAVSDVVVVATHGGRRRVYTLSFGCDASAAAAAAGLAKQMFDSFVIEAPQAVTRHRVEAVAAAAAAGAGSGALGGGGAASASDDETHVNVWERGVAGATSGGGGGGGSSALSPGSGGGGGVVVVYETPSSPADVQWVPDAVEPARLTMLRPAAWAGTGLLSERAAGGLASSTTSGAAAAAAGLRWWRVAWTCDRRESSFKQVGLLCVDVTPLYDLMGGGALAATGTAAPGALATLLGYLAVRLKSEVAEAAAADRGEAAPPLAFTGQDAALRPWADVFAQRWPANCRLLAPPPPLTAAAIASSLTSAVPPVHLTAVASDLKRGAGSRLLKATGWLRTNGAVSAAAGTHRGAGGRGSGGGGGGGGGLVQHPWGGSNSSLESFGAGGGGMGGPSRSSSPSPIAAAGGGFGRRRRSSTLSRDGGGGGGSVYSSLGLDHDASPAEGAAVAVTAALLLSLHEATVALPAPPGPGGRSAAPAPPPQPRVFANVAAFVASTDVWARVEGLARHAFASLEVT